MSNNRRVRLKLKKVLRIFWHFTYVVRQLFNWYNFYRRTNVLRQVIQGSALLTF